MVRPLLDKGVRSFLALIVAPSLCCFAVVNIMESTSAKVIVNLPLDQEVFESILDVRRVRIASLKNLLKMPEPYEDRWQEIVGGSSSREEFLDTIKSQISDLENSILEKSIQLEELEFYLDLVVRSEGDA